MNGRKIGNRLYFVSSGIDGTQINYTQDDLEGVHVLCSKDDTPLGFRSELKAHEYLNKMTETGTMNTKEGVWWVSGNSEQTDEELKVRFEELFGEPCKEVHREKTSTGVNVFVGPVSQEKIDRRKRGPSIE